MHGKLRSDDKNLVKVLGGQYTADAVGETILSWLLSAILDKPDLANRVSNDELVLSSISREEIAGDSDQNQASGDEGRQS